MAAPQASLARILITLTLLWAWAGLHAQSQVSLLEGPLQKKQLHERFLRLVRGGDGNFYAFKGSAGHYWQFGAEGERSLQVIRLNAALQPDDTMKIKRLGTSGQVKNVFEVLVAPEGIGLLTIAKDPITGQAALQLRQPDFVQQPTQFTCTKLADMPGFSIGFDKPMVRVAYSPDSNYVIVAWRRLAQEQGSDRSLTCIILDRELQVLREPFSPFKKFDQDVQLREMLILDEDHLLFSAQTLQYGNALTGPGTIGYGILHYAVEEDALRVIRFSSRKEVPVETRLGLGVDGEILAAGWYLDQTSDRRAAGVFLGRITGADSLEDLVMEPFPELLRNALIRRETRKGAVGIRTGYHSAFLPAANGYTFVLHLRGETDPGLLPRAPRRNANNTLHCWRFDADFQPLEHTMSGFYNAAREEYSETFSWRPLLIDGQWHAMASDYSTVRHDNAPIEAASYLWRLPGGDFEPLPLSGGKEFCVLAPREMVKIGEHEWVAMAIAGKRWRLVRVVVR